MKKRYFYLISFTFLMFLVFLFLAYAAAPDKWIECKNPADCADADNKCLNPNTGNKCCKITEKLLVNGVDNCCISNSWAAPGSDICDGLDNDCNDATEDGSGETAPDCALQSGVCSGSRKSCSSGSWLACTSTNYGSNYQSAESACNDGLDNDCDGTTDCADMDCIGDPGPGGANCCRTATLTANCGNDDCKLENCVSNQCSITDREAGVIDECGTCQACDTDGGNCVVKPANEGKNCIGLCTYCDAAGTCANRNQCDATECTAVAGTYCDALGGNCATPDASSAVCLNCAPDTTAQTWTWTPPNHQDAGKGFNANLFNSNNLDCPDNSCSDNSAACRCYDTSGVLGSAKHKLALATGSCCGDDASEYYKPDYHGPECTADVNDCVWSDGGNGNAQASNTGNKEYWCYQHEWNECIVNDDIGKKIGGVTCAGTSTNKKWTGSPLAENSYSCIDGFDNDGDTEIDCADTDCNNQVCGTQTRTCTANENKNCNTAAGDIYADTGEDKTCNKFCSSSTGTCGACTPAGCDRVLWQDCVNSCSEETSPSYLAADSPVTDNNLCTSGQTTCPSTTSADVCGAENVLTEYYCSGNDAASSTYDCDNSDNANLDGTCGTGADSCKTRDYSCTDNSNMDYCSYTAMDLDASSSSCAAGGTAASWIATGESAAHGEYTAGQAAAACCGDDSNEKIITAGVGDTKCCSLTTKCIDSGGVCRDNVNENTNALCSDGIDNDCDGKIDCADSDCAGTISGSVKDTNNAPIGSAKIDVLSNAVVVHTTFANALGSYTVNDNLDVICGSYDMISSATGYVSSTRTMQLQPNQALQNVDFALALGTTCEADCTYAGDDLIHAECQGVNNCDLCNFNCGFCNPAIASSSCNLAKIGWIRDYNDPSQPECQETGCVVECGEGCPIAKIETKSSVTCDEENIIKVTKLVTYKGKLAKLVIVTCG